MAALRAAVAAGWSDAAHAARDPDLAPLHDRPEFRPLLAELFDHGFPVDPFARELTPEGRSGGDRELESFLTPSSRAPPCLA